MQCVTYAAKRNQQPIDGSWGLTAATTVCSWAAKHAIKANSFTLLIRSSDISVIDHTWAIRSTFPLSCSHEELDMSQSKGRVAVACAHMHILGKRLCQSSSCI